MYITATIWHVSLNDEPMDHPLPKLDEIEKPVKDSSAALAQAVATFNSIEAEAEMNNAGAEASPWSEVRICV